MNNHSEDFVPIDERKWNKTCGSWPRLLQKSWLVFLSSSAASAWSSLEQFGVDRRGCSGGDVVGGGAVAGGVGGGCGVES